MTTEQEQPISMEHIALELYQLNCQCFLGSVIPSCHITTQRSGTYTFKDELRVQEDRECTVFGKMEHGMSIALHLLVSI